MVRSEAMGWLHNLLLFKMVMEMYQSRACIAVPAEGDSKVPESCGSFGLSRLHGANFSAVFCPRFLVQPNLELQQLQRRCGDNVY